MFSAHPLSIYARVDMTLVDGVVRFDRDRDGDDQRVYVDPSEEVVSLDLGRHTESCMLGADLDALVYGD